MINAATTITATATTNNATATTVLHKLKSKLRRRRFRWDQFVIIFFFSFVASDAFFGNKSVKAKVHSFY